MAAAGLTIGSMAAGYFVNDLHRQISSNQERIKKVEETKASIREIDQMRDDLKEIRKDIKDIKRAFLVPNRYP